MNRSIKVDKGHITIDINALRGVNNKGRAFAIGVASQFCNSTLQAVKHELQSKHIWERSAAATELAQRYSDDLDKIQDLLYCTDSFSSRGVAGEARQELVKYFYDLKSELEQAQRTYFGEAKDFAVFFGKEISAFAVTVGGLIKSAAGSICGAIKDLFAKIGNLMQPVINWCKDSFGQVGAGIPAFAVTVGGLIKSAAGSICGAIKDLFAKIGNLMQPVINWCKDHPVVTSVIIVGVVACAIGAAYYGFYVFGQKSAIAAGTVAQKVKSCGCDSGNAFAREQCRRACGA